MNYISIWQYSVIRLKVCHYKPSGFDLLESKQVQ